MNIHSTIKIPKKSKDGLAVSQLCIMSSAAGYYIGRVAIGVCKKVVGPYDRVTNYFCSEKEAQDELARWRPKQNYNDQHWQLISN